MAFIPSATGRRGSSPSPTGTYANREETIERLWTFISGINVSGFTMFTGSGSGKLFVSDSTGSASWTSIGSLTASFADNLFTIFDNGDSTKLLAFQCSGITTGTTRTMTIPDVSMTLAGITNAQTFSNTNTFQAPAAGSKAIIAKDFNASQTASVFEAQNSAGAVQASLAREQTFGAGGVQAKGWWLFEHDTVNPIGNGASWAALALSTATPAYSWGTLIDDAASGMPLTVDGAINVTSTALVFPGAGGTVVTTTATQTINGKTFTTSNFWDSGAILATGTSTLTGCSFADRTTNTKKLFVRLNNATGNNVLTFTTAAARTFTVQDPGANTDVLLGSLTATRVPFVSSAGILTDDADMTFATDTLTVTGLVVGTTKVSSYNGIATVTSGVPSLVAQANLTAQSAAIAATTIYAVPASGAGMYRVSWVATVTTAATTSSVLGGANGFQLTYTDNDDSVVKTSAPTSVNNFTSAGNTTATQVSGVFCANCKASTNLQYAFDYTSVGGTAMQYNLHIRVEPV